MTDRRLLIGGAITALAAVGGLVAYFILRKDKVIVIGVTPTIDNPVTGGNPNPDKNKIDTNEPIRVIGDLGNPILGQVSPFSLKEYGWSKRMFLEIRNPKGSLIWTSSVYPENYQGYTDMEKEIWKYRKAWGPLIKQHMFSTGQMTQDTRFKLDAGEYTNDDVNRWISEGKIRVGDNPIYIAFVLYSLKPGLLNKWGMEYTDSMRNADNKGYNSKVSITVPGQGAQRGDPTARNGTPMGISGTGTVKIDPGTKETGFITIPGIKATTSAVQPANGFRYSSTPGFNAKEMFPGNPRPVKASPYVMPIVKR